MDLVPTTMLDSLVQQKAKARLGKTLRGKWLLEDLVGVGGMAAVYRASHRNGARVAIKMLHPLIAENEELRQRFIGEGYAANRIKHPAVVSVHDDDVDDDGTPFLVMDFVEGQTLADKIQDRRFNDDELLDVAEQVCSLLDAAHEAGVVHRDLKPDNLLLDNDGRVRVLDFGIARLLEDDKESFFSTKTGIAFGTPGFISPEQALGHREKVGPRTDIFALGATLFYLATGEFLHAADTPQELLILVATQPARWLRMVAPHISAEVGAIVDRATRMALVDRWQSAREMLEAVRALQAKRADADLSLATSALVGDAMLPPPPSDPKIAVETRDAPIPIEIPRSLIDIATRPSIARSTQRRRRSVLAAGGALALVVGAFSFISAARAPEARATTPTLLATSQAVSDQAALMEEDQVVTLAPTVVVADPVAPPRATPKTTQASLKKLTAPSKTDPQRLIDALLANRTK
jgi:eukaryotic-like serine/threonine-protein kinase